MAQKLTYVRRAVRSCHLNSDSNFYPPSVNDHLLVQLEPLHVSDCLHVQLTKTETKNLATFFQSQCEINVENLKSIQLM